MKANKIFAAALAALAFVACTPKVEVESVTLDKSVVTIAVGETATLTATVNPEGAAVVTWESENPAVATVNDGVVTAVAEGTSLIVAKAGEKKATCFVTVGKAGGDDDEFAQLLKGSDYYVFALGENAFAKIASKVRPGNDFRMNGAYEDGVIPADVTSVLEIWGSTFEGGAGGGLNCFGENEGYISLVSATGEGWGLGCGGLRQIHRTIDLTGVTGEYTLAIAYKCPANNQAGKKAKFSLYSTTKGQPEVGREVEANTAGEWALAEYKMSDLFAAGLNWTAVADCTDGTYAWYSLGLLVEGIGNGLDVDAILVYKK